MNRDLFRNIYFIGGSPCSGKSTLVEKLSSQYDMVYYKADDHFDEHLKQGCLNNIEEMAKFARMSCDETWLNRSVSQQVVDEISFYKNEINMCIDDIRIIKSNKPIIAEGAVFMPELISEYKVPKSRYICIVPSYDFQIEHYKKRLWVNAVLKDSSDKEKAFDNWMKRDAELAIHALNSAKQNKYKYFISDIGTDFEVLFDEILNIFELV